MVDVRTLVRALEGRPRVVSLAGVPGFESARLGLRVVEQHSAPDASSMTVRLELHDPDHGSREASLDSDSWALRITALPAEAQPDPAANAPRSGLNGPHTYYDQHRCTLVLGEHTIDFSRRQAIREILTLLLERQGRLVSKVELAERVFGSDYHPLQHDNTLWLRVRRLRALLGDRGPKIVTRDAGYVLHSPSPIKIK